MGEGGEGGVNDRVADWWGAPRNPFRARDAGPPSTEQRRDVSQGRRRADQGAAEGAPAADQRGPRIRSGRSGRATWGHVHAPCVLVGCSGLSLLHTGRDGRAEAEEGAEGAPVCKNENSERALAPIFSLTLHTPANEHPSLQAEPTHTHTHTPWPTTRWRCPRVSKEERDGKARPPPLPMRARKVGAATLHALSRSSVAAATHRSKEAKGGDQPPLFSPTT